MSKSELEVSIAHKIASGIYGWDSARKSAEIQSLDFHEVKLAYGRIYENEQCNDAGFNHGSI